MYSVEYLFKNRVRAYLTIAIELRTRLVLITELKRAMVVATVWRRQL